MVLGLSSDIQYKKLNFSFAGRAHFGNQVYNNVETNIGFQDRLFDLGVLKNIHAVGIENNIKEQAQATYSDAYIQDASFFRMDHITLGYQLDKIAGININFYTTIQNAFVITKYRGLDPEVFRGIDNNLYPRPKVYVVGLSATF